MGLSLKEMNQITDFKIGEKIYNELNESNQSHFLENAGGDIRGSLIRYGELYRERAKSAGINEIEDFVDFNEFYERMNPLRSNQ